MPLLHFTGFEAGGLYEGNVVGACAISSSTKRSGGYSCRIQGDGLTQNYIQVRPLNPTTGAYNGDFSVPASYTTIWINFHSQASTTADVLKIVSMAATTKARLVRISGGFLRVYDKDGAVVTTGSTAMALDTWYKIYFKVSNSTTDIAADGAYEVRINGTVELSGTCKTLSSSISNIRVGSDDATASYDAYYDDVAVGSTGFLENYRTVILKPNANGTYTSTWANQGDTSQYKCVDDVPTDDATTFIDYVAGALDNKTYCCNLEDSAAITVGAGIPIYALKGMFRVRRNGGGVNISWNFMCRSGGSDFYLGTGSQTATSGTWVNFGILWTQDPATTSAWTSAALDALQIGVQVTANFATNTAQCTQIVLECLVGESDAGLVDRVLLFANSLSGCLRSGIKTSAEKNLSVSARISGLGIIANQARGNGADGIAISRGTIDSLAGGDYSSLYANVACRNAANGIVLQGGADAHEVTEYVDYVTIRGNVACDDPRTGGVQDRGIWFDQRVRNCVVIGNIAQGNSAASILDGSSDPTVNQIAHNLTD